MTVYYSYLSLQDVCCVSAIYHDTNFRLLAFSFCWLDTSGITGGTHTQDVKMTVDHVRSTGTGSQRGRTILAEVHFVEPGLARSERVEERESVREEQGLT